MESNEILESNVEQPNDDYFDFDVIVENREYIKATVRVTKGFEAKSGKPKMVVYRKELVNLNIDFIESLIASSDETIEKLMNDTENFEENSKEINLATARKIRLESELETLKELLAKPYQEWTATFRYPGLSERVSIDARSYTENAFADKSEFNEFEAIKAKLDLLLVEWTVKNKGKLVPIKQAMKCDPDLLKAFIEDFDNQLNNYVFSERKK